MMVSCDSDRNRQILALEEEVSYGSFSSSKHVQSLNYLLIRQTFSLDILLQKVANTRTFTRVKIMKTIRYGANWNYYLIKYIFPTERFKALSSFFLKPPRNELRTMRNFADLLILNRMALALESFTMRN